MGAVATLKYDMAIMLPKEKTKAKYILELCLLNSIVLTFFFFLLILIFEKYLVDLLNLQALSKWMLLLPLSALVLSINNILINWYNRNKQYKTISANRISRNTIITGANIAFGFAKSGHGGLIASQLISDALVASYCLIMYYFKVLNRKIEINLKALKDIAREYKDFPSFTLPSTFIDTFSMQLPILLITAFFSSSMSGSYFFALRILAIPISLIGAAYAQTFFQAFVSYIQRANFYGARCFLCRSWLLLFSLSAVPSIVLFFWGEPLFSFIFGSNWSESGTISSVLIFYIMFSFISSPTSSTYVALRMQQYSLFFGVSVLIYRFFSFYIGYLMNDFYLALKILVTCEVIEIVIYNSVILLKLKSMSISH